MSGIEPIIAIDAMGGDVGLKTTLYAVARSQRKYPNLRFILVGDEAAIRTHKAFNELNSSTVEILHTTEVVEMSDSPSTVLRRKRESSMWKALELVRDGKAHACVSAGNTGALMACAYFIIKMIKGISRPAICATVPSRFGHRHWLDLGANVESKPPQLLQFALMGTELAKAVNDISNPRVGLLNVGEEEIKGNDIVKETAELLKKSPLNYIGFVEGNDIFMRDDIDVVVCDGFVGNVALKTSEGVAKFIQESAKDVFKKNLFTKTIGAISYIVLKRLKAVVDPRNYNGATLLGLQGIVIKSHGNADDIAFANAINIARLEIEHGVIAHIREQLEQYQA